MTDAIVLAGGGSEPGLDEHLPNKGFIEVAGRPLVVYVTAALRGVREIQRIAVVGPPTELRRVLPADVSVVPDGEGLMDNIERAVQAFGTRDLTLVAASDIPLLTSTVVQEFLRACTKDRADFYYAVVPQDVMQRRFPNARKTYAHLMEGTFTGGSVMLFNPQVLSRVRPFVERVIAARKKPWLLAQLFGSSITMKFIAGRLSMEEIVAKATEVVGIAVTPVIVPHPELALDVDAGKPEHLQLIREVLEQRDR